MKRSCGISDDACAIVIKSARVATKAKRRLLVAAGMIATACAVLSVARTRKARQAADLGFPRPFTSVDLGSPGVWWTQMVRRPLENADFYHPEMSSKGASIRQPAEIPAGMRYEVTGLALPWKITGDLALEALLDLKASRRTSDIDDATSFLLGLALGGEATFTVTVDSQTASAQMRARPPVSCDRPGVLAHVGPEVKTLLLRVTRAGGKLEGWASVDGERGRRLCRAPAPSPGPTLKASATVYLGRPPKASLDEAWRTRSSDVYALRRLSLSCVDPRGCQALGINR